jgi:type III pantothenate kinase
MSSVYSACYLVVDVGNTRIKWGLCDDDSVLTIASLPPDAPESWQRQLETWQLVGPAAWYISGVHPPHRDRFADWVRGRGDRATLVTCARQLPLEVALEHPDRVGIDRLLDAVAVNTRRRAHTPAVIVDAGTAVTVDLLDRAGRFQGGAILPGFRLMAESLHRHTALLPLIEVQGVAPPVGKSTIAAMHAGIFHAVAGGIDRLIQRMTPGGGDVDVFLGGGDGDAFAEELSRPVTLWPQMTLEGLRLAARDLQ